MTVKELLSNITPDEILNFLKEGNFDILKRKTDEELLDNAKKALDEFKNIKPNYDAEYNDFNVFITKYKDDLASFGEKPEEYFNVEGYHVNELINNKADLSLTWEERKGAPLNIIPYGLDFMPRSILSRLNICPLSIDKYGLKRIAFEVFWELTFYGWTENTIKEKENELEESIRETEEHPELLRPIDELWDEIGFKDERTPEQIQLDFNYSMSICEENYYDHNQFLLEYVNKYC